jgi:hypothetical protein
MKTLFKLAKNSFAYPQHIDASLNCPRDILSLRSIFNEYFEQETKNMSEKLSIGRETNYTE